MTIEVCCGKKEAFKRACEVRTIVFTQEQGVPSSIERDALDDVAWHFVYMEGDHAVAAGRLLAGEEKTFVVGRVAVLASHRGRGIGEKVMGAMIRKAWNAGALRVELHAQLEAVNFYDKLGFESRGDVYMEAGIPHITMSIARPSRLEEGL